MIRPRTREEIEDARRGLTSLASWNDRHDVIGLSPDHWISPIDFSPIGWINKGRKAVKAARVGYRLGKRGLSTFGRAAYREARQHAAGAGMSLIGKGARRYVSTKQSSGSSSRAYQQNGSPGGTRTSKKKSYSLDGLGLSWRQFERIAKGTYNPCVEGYTPRKVRGKWMCVPNRKK